MREVLLLLSPLAFPLSMMALCELWYLLADSASEAPK